MKNSLQSGVGSKTDVWELIDVSLWVRLIAVVSFSGILVLLVYYFLREIGVIKSEAPIPGAAQLPRSHERWTDFTAKDSRSRLKLFLEIVFLVLVSRLLVVLIAEMGLMLIRNQAVTFPQSFDWMWNKWDSGHYLDIARKGYLNRTESRFFIVFFPLYPVLVRLCAFGTRSVEWSGVLVSNLSLIVAAYYLHQLVALDFNRRTAWNAVILLLFFPVSVFLGIVYTESLFLALSILTFYQVRRQRWLRAGVFGFLAALSRNFGVLLVLPALVELMIATQLWEQIKTKSWRNLKGFVGKSAMLGLIPLGYFGYLVINKWVTGDWFKYMVYQKEHWGQRIGFFADNLAGYANNALTWKPCERIALWIPELMAIFAVAILIFYGFGRIRFSYVMYMAIYLYICVSATWLISGPRYLMGLFPVYLALARLARGRMASLTVILLSGSLCVFYTLAFVLDYYVM